MPAQLSVPVSDGWEGFFGESYIERRNREKMMNAGLEGW